VRNGRRMKSAEVREPNDQAEVAHLSVIYIAGYGRSGSTVLGTLLGSAPGVVHAGELSCLAVEWPDPTRRCSCGKPLSECPTWLGLDPDFILKPREWGRLRRAEALSRLPRLALGWASREERRIIRKYERNVLSTLSKGTGCQIIVDSSKTARAAAARPLALERYGEASVFLVHLTRHGRMCLQSLLSTGSNWKLEGRAKANQPGAARASSGWLLANLSASISGRLFFKGRYCRLRFEDLLEDPDRVLGDLEDRLGLDLTAVRDQIRARGSFKIGHVLGGNRLRFENELRLQAARAESPAKLSRYQRLVFSLTAGWLNRLYGYDQ
jgi:hypothetical protein